MGTVAKVMMHSSSLPSRLSSVPSRLPVADLEIAVTSAGTSTSCPRPPGADQGSIAGASVLFGAADSTVPNITASPARPVIADAPSVGSWGWNLRAHPTPADATPTSERSADGGDESPLHFTVVLTTLAIVATALAAILAEFKDTLNGWSTAPKVMYCIITVMTMASLAVGIIAALSHAASVPRNHTMLSDLAFCAKLGAILSSILLVVTIFCKLGRWGCVAGVPSGAVIACLMTVVWIRGDKCAAAQVGSNC